MVIIGVKFFLPQVLGGYIKVWLQIWTGTWLEDCFVLFIVTNLPFKECYLIYCLVRSISLPLCIWAFKICERVILRGIEWWHLTDLLGLPFQHCIIYDPEVANTIFTTRDWHASATSSGVYLGYARGTSPWCPSIQSSVELWGLGGFFPR